MSLALKPLVGYFSSWRVFQNKQLALLQQDLNGLTHLIYSFAKVEQNAIRIRKPEIDVETPFPEGEAQGLRGAFGQLALLQERHPHLHILLSLAGGARGLSDAAATADHRKEFARNAVRFLRRWPVFTGLDLVWLYPVSGNTNEEFAGRARDKFNFTKLVQTLRQALNEEECRRGSSYCLTVAGGAETAHIRNLEPYELSKWTDFISVMSYDFVCGARPVYHNAPLYEDPDGPYTTCGPPSEQNVSAAMLRYLRAEVPCHKLYMSLPFYGRRFHNCSLARCGEYQPCMATQKDGDEIDYRDITKEYLAHPGVQRCFNPRSLVPYLFREAGKQFITYDDPCSLRHKVEWAKRFSLGGLAIWELGADDESYSLLHTVRKTWQTV